MKNKAFTLIELLAVIVILGVILLVAIPSVMNYIERSKRSAFKDSAYGLIDATQMYYASEYQDSSANIEVTCNKVSCLVDDNKTLEFKGKVPSGTINITSTEDVSIKLTNDAYCAYKNVSDNEVTVTEGNCDGITVDKGTEGTTEIPITSLKNMDLIIDSTVVASTTSAAALVNVPDMNKYTYFMIVINNGGDRLGNIMVHIPTLISTNQRYFANYSNGSFDAVAWVKYSAENQVYLARYVAVATSVMLYGIY